MDLSRKTITQLKELLDALPIDERIELFSALESDGRAGVRKLSEMYRSRQQRAQAREAAYRERTKYERMLHDRGFALVAGVDEAGRGALAGPIVAAAVILPADVDLQGVRDSKQLSAEQREQQYERIVECATGWCAIRIENTDIDIHGIQWANLSALEMAVRGLDPLPDYVLSDAFKITSLEMPHLALIKGDALSLTIGAASILAKVTRDRIMCDYHERYPEYGFDQHKGYSTELHVTAIRRYKPSPIHRTCFAPVADCEQLHF